MGKLKLSHTFDSKRQDIPEGLKCVASACKVHIKRGGGVSPNTFQDSEDVMWIGAGKMHQASWPLTGGVQRGLCWA